jgi:molybdate transport system substrate-binding protein
MGPRRTYPVRIFTIAAIIALMAMTGSATAAEIKALISTAVESAMEELVPQFERASGHALRIGYGPSGGVARRLAGGEAADLIILADSGLDELIKQGMVVPGRTDFARTGIGVAVRKGAPKPDISTPDALRRALLNAQAVAHTAPAGGGITAMHLLRMFEKLGIAQEVAAKTKLAAGGPNGRVSTIVETGEADIGLQQISELMSNPGVDVVGLLPAELQQITIYSAGVTANATQADAAKAFIRFISAPAAAPAFTGKGLGLN